MQYIKKLCSKYVIKSTEGLATIITNDWRIGFSLTRVLNHIQRKDKVRNITITRIQIDEWSLFLNKCLRLNFNRSSIIRIIITQTPWKFNKLAE